LRQAGFICGDGLVVEVDSELLLLQYDSVVNRFTNVSKFRGGISDECREVEVNVEEQYSVKYFPRNYYTIFRIESSNRSGYLLENFNGTSGSAWFYTCDDYKECRKLIDELEGE
jgi:hypothetical protein